MRKLGMIVVLVAAAALASWLSGGSPPDRTLPVRAQFDGQGLSLINTGGTALAECSAKLNSRFNAVADFNIPSNGIYRVQAVSFISNGIRFNPSVDRVERIFVACRRPQAADISLSLS